MIYIHVPFCRRFCTYCDFYSEIAPKECGGILGSWQDSMLKEIESMKDEISAPAEVKTLYIGGGTPSVLPLSVLGSIVSAIKALCPDGFMEFTVEVNPDDVTPSYASGLRDLGVDRVSMGVQSFDDGILRWMNRRHDSAGAVKAFHTLREAGFGNISIDLIFGLPQLSDMLWADTVSKALALAPEHVSAYQLSVEGGSALSEMLEKGEWEEAPEDLCRRQYGFLCAELAKKGYRHYEISNFALPGREAIHNSAYWRRVPYVGLGPGAHSLIRSAGEERRVWNTETLSGWTREGEVLTPEDIRAERIMLGLRTSDGMEISELESLAGKDAVLALKREGALVEFGNDGESVPGRIRIPEDRFFVSDEIIRELI